MIVGVPADMALPKRFLEPVEPTPELVEEACRRLRLFAFVGCASGAGLPPAAAVCFCGVRGQSGPAAGCGCLLL